MNLGQSQLIYSHLSVVVMLLMLHLGSTHMVMIWMSSIPLWGVLLWNLSKGWLNLYYVRIPLSIILGVSVIPALLNLSSLIESLATLVILLCLYQTLQLKESRDYQKLHILSFAGVVLAAILDFQIYYGILLLVYMLIITTSLTLNMLYADLERSVGFLPNYQYSQASESAQQMTSQTQRQAQLSHKRLTRYLKSKRLIPTYFLVGIAFIAGILCVSAFVLFFMMPRLDGQWMQGYQRTKSTSGFSENSSLRSDDTISLSNQVAFRVKIYPLNKVHQQRLHRNPNTQMDNEGYTQTQAPIPTHHLYFIGKRQNLYNHGIWQKEKIPQQKKTFYQQYWFDHRKHRQIQKTAKLWKQSYFIEHRGHQSLFTLYTPLLLQVPHTQKTEMTLSADLDIKYQNTKAIQYDLLSTQAFDVTDPSHQQNLLDLSLTDYTQVIQQQKRFQNYLQVPQHLQADLKQWTEALIDQNMPVRMIMTRLSNHFSQHYTYSLKNHFSDQSTDDPIIYFLNQSKAGHCEYFASALALTLRSLGIPTRYVSGYRGGRWSSYQGGYYRVAQKDAHAWVEVWQGGNHQVEQDLNTPHAWFTIDPTPSLEESRFSQSSTWQVWQDAIEFFWFRYIIGFDTQDQMKALQKLNQEIDQAQSKVSQYWYHIKYYLTHWYQHYQRLLKALLLVIGMILLTFILYKVGHQKGNKGKIFTTFTFPFIQQFIQWWKKLSQKRKLSKLRQSLIQADDTQDVLSQQKQKIIYQQIDVYYVDMIEMCRGLGYQFPNHWGCELILHHLSEQHQRNDTLQLQFYHTITRAFDMYQKLRYASQINWDDFQYLEKNYQQLKQYLIEMKS